MKYKLLKDLPCAILGTEVTLEEGSKGVYFMNREGHENFAVIQEEDISKWLEPIVEKKTYDDLNDGDTIFINDVYGLRRKTNFSGHARSETFLTREEAEDEHKRREWAVRKDKFVPKEGEKMAYIGFDRVGLHNKFYFDKFWKESYLLSFIVNSGLAFRTEEELKNAIDNHDLIRLFYTIR